MVAATRTKFRGVVGEWSAAEHPVAPLRGRRYLLGLVATAVAVFAAARIGQDISYPHTGASTHGSYTAFWPPVGVGIAALVAYGTRMWPGILFGSFLAAGYATPFSVVLGQLLATVIASVVAAALLVRFGARRPGLRVRDVLILIVCAAAGTLLGATVGVLVIWLAGAMPPGGVPRIWRTWWLSDLTGALVVTPALLTWAGARWRPKRSEAVEGALLIAALIGLSYLSSQRDVPYVLFPVLIWAGLRFGPRGATVALLATAAITIWDTSSGSGPFVRSSLTDSLLATQVFLGVAALTSMILAAVTAERAASETAARGLAHEQAALRRIATLLVSESEPARLFSQVMEEAARALGVASASLVRYENPGLVTVMGGWSGSDTLLFPVGSTIELGTEGSALVEVYRTGEARRVTYPEESRLLAGSLRSHGYRSSVAAPVSLAGGLWGALVASSVDESPLPAGSEQRLGDFAELVAQALANADAHDKLASSRARIVDAGDAERRRLERNLHDGAQQRLVMLAIDLSLAEDKVDADPARAKALIAGARDQARQALGEIRDVVRGTAPAILLDRGLVAALGAVAGRSAIPTYLDSAVAPNERLPHAVERAAYYVVSEALTNVAKHAGATRCDVTIRREPHRLGVWVRDDGHGGAAIRPGGGLAGLRDRVEALDGKLLLHSPAGGPTILYVELPLLAG